MELIIIKGHSFLGTQKTDFSYKLRQPLKVFVTEKDGEFFAKSGNEYYQIVGSGSCKEEAIKDFCLEFHLRVLDLDCNKSISSYKKTFDFLSKYLNL